MKYTKDKIIEIKVFSNDKATNIAMNMLSKRLFLKPRRYIASKTTLDEIDHFIKSMEEMGFVAEITNYYDILT